MGQMERSVVRWMGGLGGLARLVQPHGCGLDLGDKHLMAEGSDVSIPQSATNWWQMDEAGDLMAFYDQVFVTKVEPSAMRLHQAVARRRCLHSARSATNST